MFGILYIVLSFLTGKEAAGFLLEAGENREKRGNQIWLSDFCFFWNRNLIAYLVCVCGIVVSSRMCAQ